MNSLPAMGGPPGRFEGLHGIDYAAILIGFLLDSIPDDQRGNLFDLTGRISSFLVGTLGAMMFLAILKVPASGRAVIVSALAGMSAGLVWAQGHWLFGLPRLAWMWVIPVSSLITFGSALALSRICPARNRDRPNREFVE